MAIEGPLHELGLHDLFQLLDLSRKTGVLTVTSASRDREGSLTFDRGAVTAASLDGRPDALIDHLMLAGRISERELARVRDEQSRRGGSPELGALLVERGTLSWSTLERHARLSIEEVAFELMCWRGGYFTFEERSSPTAADTFAVRLSTESLLMQAAHRSDEWLRIEGTVPHLGVVPTLTAPPGDDAEPQASIDLGSDEWEVLATVDGAADVRALAARLMRSPLDVAQTVHSLVSAGLLELRGVESSGVPEADADYTAYLEESLAALRAGAIDQALTAARWAIGVAPEAAEPRLVYARALTRLGRHDEAAAELQQAVHLDALNAAVHRELGNAAARRGDHAEAVGCWERYLRMHPDAADAGRVRSALHAASQLRDILHEHADV